MTGVESVGVYIANEEWLGLRMLGYIPQHSLPQSFFIPTHLWRWNGQIVPKRGIQHSDAGELAQKKANIDRISMYVNRLILPKINYNLIKLNSYFNLKSDSIPLCLQWNRKFCLYWVHYTSGQLDNWLLACCPTTQYLVAQQRCWTVYWCKRRVSSVLAIRNPLFRNCLLCIPSHARRGQTAGLRGGTALYNYTPWVRLFILVLFLGQLIPIF